MSPKLGKFGVFMIFFVFALSIGFCLFIDTQHPWALLINSYIGR